MKKLIFSCLVLFLFSCGKGKIGESAKIDVEFTQYDFISAKLIISKIEKGQKIFLGNFPIKVRMENFESTYQTDEKGSVLLKIPEELTTKLENIYVYTENKEFKFNYIKRKILIELGLEPSFDNYFEINFLVYNIKKTQLWPPESENYSEEKVFFNGNLNLISYGFNKNISVLNGYAKVCLNQQEAENFWSSPTLTAEYDSKKYTFDFSKLKPSGNVIFLEKNIGTINFRGRIKNETLKTVEVEVIAGYKENNKWLIGDITGIKYFNSQIVKIIPGEEREISFHYPFPLPSGQKDAEIKVISTTLYNVSCK